MEQGGLTAVSLVQEYIDRIDAVDRTGPSINSVIEINPDALSIARDLDEYFIDNGKIGPLHGIPVLLKDNIDTKDEMQTTAGSLAIEQYGGKVTQDAFVVNLLRKAGAIILGKTNLSEMANFRGQRSTSGWSSRGGLTKNPYALNRNTSGSSSGSAAAVTANLCMVSLGTETDGSVISPANNNGIVGIKPSIGLVSRSGIIPIAATQDTAGPMARTVRDAAILLDSIVAYDSRDPITEAAATLNPDYSEHLDDNSLQGARIGVLHKKFGTHRTAQPVWEAAKAVLVEKGATLIDVEMTYPDDWGSSSYGEAQEFAVLLYEYKQGLHDYFTSREGSQIQNIDDLIKFNEELKERTMPFFGQEHLIAASEKGDLTDDQYLDSLKDYETFRNNLSQLYQDNQLDVLLGPSGGPAWVTDLVNGDSFGFSTSQLAAVSGYCNITVPAGYAHGLPVGFSFIGGQFQEKKIINLAYAFERANPVREPPQYIAYL
jgi:amidase